MANAQSIWQQENALPVLQAPYGRRGRGEVQGEAAPPRCTSSATLHSSKFCPHQGQRAQHWCPGGHLSLKAGQQSTL
eukprot:1159501-Pelagomonas_calceolata.AAC.2